MKKDHPNETEEQRLKREKLNKYTNERLKNTVWYCKECNNGKNYTLRGKAMHLRTLKHNKINKTQITHDLIEL